MTDETLLQGILIGIWGTAESSIMKLATLLYSKKLFRYL